MADPFDPDSIGELVQPQRVHARLYTDEQIFTAEMERIFGGTWVYVAHDSEIPEPHDFVRKRLGLRPIIVTRGRDGSINVLINRCTHRGATVCRVDAGNTKNFVCPYHNWTFDNTGRLTGVPMRRGYGPSFDAAAMGLGRVRTESYRGFVFATLNPEMPSLVEHLGPACGLIDAWLDRWPGAQLQVRSGEHRLSYHGNWKLAYDNSADGYHPGFSHASLLRMRKERYGAGVDMQWVLGDVDAGDQLVTALGNGHTFLDQRAEIESYWPTAAPMPGGDRYELLLRERLGDSAASAALEVAVGSGMNLNIFPNLLIIGNQIQVIEPFSVAATTLVWYSTRLLADDLPDEINTLRMRLQEDFPAFGEPDDLANFEECQIGLAVPEMQWVDTSRHLDTGRQSVTTDGLPVAPVSSELPVRAFWAEWKKIMTSALTLTVEGPAPPTREHAASSRAAS